MERKVSLEGVMYFTKLSVLLACTWPPPRHATKWENVKSDGALGLSLLSVIFLLIPLLFSIYEYRTDSTILTQSMCFTCTCCNFILKTIVCRVQQKKSQILFHEMEEFVKNCQPHERHVLESYVNRCWNFHGIVTMTNYLATAAMVIGPIWFLQPFPTPAVYPFSVDSGIVMYMIYIHQSVVGFQCSAGTTIDCQVAMTMWFAGARLEILANEIRNASGLKDINLFIRKHQRLVLYANQASEMMRYVALTSSFLYGLATIMGGLQLAGNQPVSVKMQYGPVLFVGMINLLVCAWPAENMIRVCNLIGTEVYNNSWIDMPTKIMKDVIMILRRSQRPVLVTVGGFLPALSFRFYGSFLSGAFSYYTTIRLVIMSDSES